MLDISVIISNYNNADYIRECLDSVFNQIGVTLECIVVDDCSTDKSVFDIFDEYKRYPNFRLLKHSVNQGCGSARRDGLKEAKGEYIIFLDSDDYWNHNSYLKNLLDVARSSGSDIVRSGWMNGGIPLLEHKAGTITSNQEKIDTLLKFTTTALFSILFKRSLWDGIDYCDRPFIEDTPSYYKVLLKANAVTYIEDYGYFYRVNPNSITHTINKTKLCLFKSLSDLDFIDECTKYDVKIKFTKKEIATVFNLNCMLYGWNRESFSPYEKYYDELMDRFKEME